MYRIAVCEDELNLRAWLCAQCGELLTEQEIEHETVPFSSAEELAHALAEGTHFDLLCLDIFMTGKTGMELAQEVRQWDDQISIVFITSSTEFLLEGYGVRPIQYLLKPVQREELKKTLLTDLRLNHQPRTVTLKARGKTAVLLLAEIRYVESLNHGCTFYLAGETQSFAIGLTQAEQLLSPKQFCRCHNSFLVNLAHIKEIAGREVVLTGGIRLPIGRKYAEQFQSEFIRYINAR